MGSVEGKDTRDLIHDINYLMNALLQTWLTYTPTVTSGAGAPGAGNTINIARYLSVGKFVFVNISYTVNNKGTASGHMQFTTPSTPLDDYGAGGGSEVGGARDNALCVHNVSNQIHATDYAGNTVWQNGSTITLFFYYAIS